MISRRRYEVVLAGLLLLAAACGRSGPSSAASPTATPLQTPAPSATLAMSASPASTAAPATATATRAPKTYELDASDDGRQLSLAVGDEVELTLSTNPGTGYHWEYGDEPDAKVLEETGDTTKPPSSPLPGAPSKRTWTYLAKGAGTTSVKLSYVPPGGGEPGDTFMFGVRVS